VYLTIEANERNWREPVVTETDVRKQTRDIIAPLKGRQILLIPAMQAVQKKLGYLPLEAMEEIGEMASVSPNTVYGVATFYAQFRTKPVGRRRVAVCRGNACNVRGSERILEAIERALNLKVDETTPDREYSLETVACMGACALAPAMKINEETLGKLTTKTVEDLFPKKAKQEGKTEK
jgi:NADH-quinone oxidoreductase subunit E